MRIDYYLNELEKKIDYIGIHLDSITISELDKIHTNKL